MGRKTWFSIPEKHRPLSNRINIVLSNTLSEPPQGAHPARSVSDAINLLTRDFPNVGSIFVIGGSEAFKEVMTSGQFPSRLYLTKVSGEYQCDVFIPYPPEKIGYVKIDNPPGVETETMTENGVDFVFEVYEKSDIKNGQISNGAL